MKCSSVIAHFVVAIIITVMLLTVYISVQQSYRSSANDPQIQIARDLSDALSAGGTTTQFFPAGTIDISKSLAVFTAIFSADGKVLQSSGLLDGKFPQPPAGVFEFTNANNEDVLTWQPQTGVRLAMVFEKINAQGEGFVAVGRSLKETEIRESNLLKMIGLALAACLLILFVNLLLQTYLSKKVSINEYEH